MTGIQLTARRREDLSSHKVGCWRVSGVVDRVCSRSVVCAWPVSADGAQDPGLGQHYPLVPPGGGGPSLLLRFYSTAVTREGLTRLVRDEMHANLVEGLFDTLDDALDAVKAQANYR